MYNNVSLSTDPEYKFNGDVGSYTHLVGTHLTLLSKFGRHLESRQLHIVSFAAVGLLAKKCKAP